MQDEIAVRPILVKEYFSRNGPCRLWQRIRRGSGQERTATESGELNTGGLLACLQSRCPRRGGICRPYPRVSLKVTWHRREDAELGIEQHFKHILLKEKSTSRGITTTKKHNCPLKAYDHEKEKENKQRKKIQQG